MTARMDSSLPLGSLVCARDIVRSGLERGNDSGVAGLSALRSIYLCGNRGHAIAAAHKLPAFGLGLSPPNRAEVTYNLSRKTLLRSD